jgi:hypothetical protein
MEHGSDVATSGWPFERGGIGLTPVIYGDRMTFLVVCCCILWLVLLMLLGQHGYWLYRFVVACTRHATHLPIFCNGAERET